MNAVPCKLDIKSVCGLAFVAFALSVAPIDVSAQTQAGPMAISQIRTGWGAEQFGIVVDSPVSNPAGCSITDSYVVESSSPGYKAHYSAALLALAAAKNVTITVHNTACTVNRPTIIGVTIFR